MLRPALRGVRPVLVVLPGVLLVCAVAGCGSSGSGTDAGGTIPAVTSAGATTTAPSPVSSSGTVTADRSTVASATGQACPLPSAGFDCDFQRRFAAAQAYVATRPGTVGIVVRDRRTGAVWRNSYADSLVWTASTIKLAMTVNLFERDRAGTITLSAADRALIQRMLHSSDDDAADTLWFRYAGADHRTFNDAFLRYGMTSLRPQQGFTKFYPYWGFQKCTPEDLDRLVNYLLDKVPATDRDYILGQLRTVAANQQWGVWGAGASARPGNKDGWSLEQGGWVMNSVGFAGPGERYTLAMMNSLRGHGGYDDGKATTTQVAKLIFSGRF